MARPLFVLPPFLRTRCRLSQPEGPGERPPNTVLELDRESSNVRRAMASSSTTDEKQAAKAEKNEAEEKKAKSLEASANEAEDADEEQDEDADDSKEPAA